MARDADHDGSDYYLICDCEIFRDLKGTITGTKLTGDRMDTDEDKAWFDNFESGDN